MFDGSRFNFPTIGDIYSGKHEDFIVTIFILILPTGRSGTWQTVIHLRPEMPKWLPMFSIIDEVSGKRLSDILKCEHTDSKESGYLENYSQITEEHLTEFFKVHRELIEPWLIESVDNRSGKGWYIQEQEGGFIRSKSWIVGYYPGNDKRKFKNETEACGFFVKKWAEELRHVIENNS
ncbi:hypothetical protein OR1_00154 [Geobacter sp. OR-1]|uniref:hypothetical protein n=1 Tax=Geobacter sp. OR-1 TaxID=1266765 RepID=UPI0005432CF9|nr:hypothetical protein [Geobacter sp. OR-1]GAM07885.1 hypothetical protein OR1_00154 [Geobacter sp. OR-1]